MTTYNTGNEVGSTDVRDLYDNAENLDNLVNGPAVEYDDRLGVPRKSWAGMEQDFAALLEASGFETAVLTYTDGVPLQVDRPTQLLERASDPGTLYSIKLPSSFPVVLSGTWATDLPLLVVRSDQALRTELADIASTVEIAGVEAAALVAGTEFPSLKVGEGVKGNPQTNVGFQIHRDITATTPSYHGFNACDYFAGDGNALNPFGTDIQIGDGTQGVGFLLGHVNDFQCTDITDLGLGGNAQHFVFISQPVLKSGTISRTTHFSAIDQLGVRDTPGFGVAGFEVSGPAVGNNQTGVSTIIRHGTNAKSMHIQAGSTDAGAALTSGGAPADFQCQIINRQATASTSKGTGSFVLTAGGIGCFGSIFAGAEVSAGDAFPQLALRNGSNTLWGRMTTDGTTMRVRAEVGTTLKLGVAATDYIELLATVFRPVTDNILSGGDAAHRFTQLFAATATIGTSDGRAKTDPLPIDDKLLDAWADVQPVLFQFKDAVERKGDDARIHAGYIAQQVRDTLAAHGIDGFRYALLCEDELTEEVTEWRTVKVPRVEVVQVERESFEVIDGVLTRIVSIVDEERHVTEQMQVFNADGTPHMVEGEEYRDVKVRKGKKLVTRRQAFPVMRPLVQTVTVMDEVQEPFTVTRKTGETRMGLRNEHCLLIECAYFRRELKHMKAPRK